MAPQIRLGDIAVDVILKDIKNVHLSVHPPTGRVKISAPSRMSVDTIRVFAISKLEWIRQQQKKLREQERETPREYLERESHYVWGKRHLLEVHVRDEAPSVVLTRSRMVLTVREGENLDTKAAVVAQWYRDQLKSAVPEVVATWEPILGVRVSRIHVQQMKTRWGSCNTRTHTIRLNTELARKPKVCLDYIVVHEMVHLLEPTHNLRFVSLMDRAMPNWRHYRQKLNRLPFRHSEWGY